ncbi:dual specificity protein phosphatase 16 [Tympanuchus pallidicinctus]|uniref:dual specificity protein phosphatase 16 n=1 Tax=Tympanuchus pallidicinctus TaxID=109042 RepID=UPI00228703C6|nr:dual specificity protein phosphatase 16 [Tympanuchus pallidicinctus]XP_052546414.1 dual specificity protein phosphatase 16 [Tympanuchus pallidicinctus]XP_052546415.1 dual specificity protein phosphatase 16 [Tympanuchus pallidicinctus]XP_052546416.1 dual specificity protein phosphatase 16 [Tympanuchus pallidicinctus]XP_052546417.1 dual specificity protein phosphatase 16 [Tympanuchus pallidicinctus]XP_052546418.1 dual specificity protein phosphatase 16 [Tympanuchus pallidicinctus]XP_05254641
MADEMISTQLIVAEKLVALLESGTEKLLLIDSRPFVEYNTSHILDAININCSKLMKRRLQQDKVLITELIQHSAKHKIEIDCKQEVVVYDQSSKDVTSLSPDCFLTVLLGKLEKNFISVYLLSGGFAEFSSCFPGLCEGKSTLVPTCISQPCLPVSNIGPTRILPHLYLGCQRDVLNKEMIQQNDIGYVLNASNTCPKPDFIPESHFLRVPVNDSFCEKILPWLDKSVDFIEKAKASNGRVLVHCLAGISRSATIAIAYIMKRMDMSLDEAYRFVKEKRPTISPNFNFLGQLLDFEKKIKNQSSQPGHISKLKLLHLEKSGEHVLVPEGGQSSLATSQLCITATSEIVEPKPADPGNVPCTHLPSLEDGPLVQGINGLHVSLDKVEDSNRLKRSFSLDIKSVSYSATSSCVTASVQGFTSSEDTLEYYKHATALEGSSKLCQFSPVQEVSEQTPEASPDKEEANPPKKPQNAWQLDSQSKRHVGRSSSGAVTQRALLYPLHRSGSMEDNYRTNFLFGLSTSQQHLAKSAAGLGLKGWHSDILAPQTSAPSLTNSWYFAAESSHFYSASAIYGNSAAYSAYSCSQLPTGCEQACAVRRRTKQGNRGDSRRSWHEESSFEKQFKRRSCQMEFGESIISDNRSREELGKVGSQSSFSGSMEIIEVS